MRPIAMLLIWKYNGSVPIEIAEAETSHYVT